MAISGTDWLEVPTIRIHKAPIIQAYVREYPQNIWPYGLKNGTFTHLHLLDPESFPSTWAIFQM